MPFPPRVAGGDDLAVDVAVVGSGIAGLVCALDLLDADPTLRVGLIDKAESGASGSTPLAQGGLAAAMGSDDSPEQHAADTIRAGDGLCDSRAVEVLAREAPLRVADLIARGAVFDRHPDGTLALAREGGQSVSRSVKSADASGAELSRALHAAAMEAARQHVPRLGRLQATAVDLALGDGPEHAAVGVWLLLDEVAEPLLGPRQEPGVALLRARAVVLAAGGCGGLYAGTTNPDSATGDAVAMTWRAGGDLVDLEFVQFHPTGLKEGSGSFQRFLLTEALRGAGATLIDATGRRFMPERHPDAELAPRHIVAKAIIDLGGAWLDCTKLGPELLATEFPTVVRGVRTFGYDVASEPVPVEPCQHYMIGGVATDLHGRTSIPGLYAAGEVAATGVHGANRMAGNSLAQACVFAHRAALAVAAELPDAHAPSTPRQPAFGTVDGLDLGEIRGDLRRAMSAGAGAVRSAEGLAVTRKRLAELRGTLGEMWGTCDGRVTPPVEREAIEIANALAVAERIVSAADLRTESRGAHWREDCPAPDEEWAGVHLRAVQPHVEC